MQNPSGCKAPILIASILFVLFLRGESVAAQDSLKASVFLSITPSWSPDRNRIAFNSDRDEDQVRPNTQSSYANAWPQWSPDNSRIVFASTRDGDWEIYTMAADGTDHRRLTHASGRDAHPMWLDDNRIVFQSPRDYDNSDEVDLYTMNADGGQQRRFLAKAGFDGVPVPSPDRSRIAFQRGAPDPRPSSNAFKWDLFLVDSGGTNERQLTRGGWSSQVPSWSPDGTRLAFFSDSTGRDQLYLLNLSDGTKTQLTTSSASDNSPSFSPDGRSIAFTSDRDGAIDLYLLRLDDGHVSRLTRNLQTMAQASWSRDGQRLLFSGSGTGVDEVYVINVDGTGLLRLTRGTEGVRS